MLARDSGFFREAGVDGRLVEFEDLSDAQRGFEQGKRDGQATTLVEVLVTRSSSPRDLSAARVIAVSDGTDLLLAPKAARNVAALRALPKSGMALSDMQTVSMAQPAMEAAVAQEIAHACAVGRPTINRRPIEVKAFLRAVGRAFHRWGAEPVGSCGTIAATGHLDADLFCATLQEGLRLVPSTGQANYLGPSLTLRTTVDNMQHALAQGCLIGARPGLADCPGPFSPCAPPSRRKAPSAAARSAKALP